MNLEIIIKQLQKEYGYNTSSDSVIIDKPSENLTILSFLTSNNAVFFIVYASDEYSDIDELFRLHPSALDEDCSLFATIHNKQIRFFQRLRKAESFIELSTPVYYKHVHKTALPKKRLSENVEMLFFEADSILRDNDGMHPDEALDELCKIIFIKLYCEHNMTSIEESSLYCNYGNSEELAASIRKIYREANDASFKINGEDKLCRIRGVFADSLKSSTVAIKKIIHLFKDYSFFESDIDIKARAFQKVYTPAMRSGMGQFFTPLNVIRFIVEALGPRENELVIDPFSGSGHFLAETTNYLRSNTNKTSKSIDEYVKSNLYGIEKSERMVRIAATDFQLYFGKIPSIICSDALLPFDSYAEVSEESFDIVMTNPPFGSILQADAFNYLDGFELLNNRSRVPLEVLGLERSVQLLKPGGRLGIVLPDSIFANKTNSFVREWIKQNLDVIAIIGLPLATFAPFGANIKTSILFAKKPHACSKHESNLVFTAQIDDIGYDTKGQMTNGSDWKAVLAKLIEFMEGDIQLCS